ncbi:transcription factor HES-1-B [Myxocyprinus asiaticus]|uniref:transcription factor HES-1-B n=1 Tax=Myxocyprinus asiaticus TaxID=70543 RepID=UPI0022213F6E|nr:transcription factor HES-1-B [Myxocyprinus asiaticus]
MSGISQRRSKISKPLMERRRRARINACIGELRALLIQAHVTTSCQSSKLEKAEILEFTVRHLRALHRRYTVSDEWSRFCAGYVACVREITCFFRTADPLQDRHHPDTSSQNRVGTLTHCTRVWRPWS